MLVTTQHTPQTSSNVLLLVVLLMPPTTTTTNTNMVMRCLLLWPSIHNKRTLISIGIAGKCRGAMCAGVSAGVLAHIMVSSTWSAHKVSHHCQAVPAHSQDIVKQ